MAPDRSSRHDDDIHDFHQIANGIPNGSGTNGSSSATGNAVAGPSMLLKPETRTPRPIAVPQNEPRTYQHRATGWFNNTNDLRQGIKSGSSRGRTSLSSSNPVAANTLVSTRPDVQPPLKRPRHSEPTTRPGTYGHTRSINRDTGTDTGWNSDVRTTKPRGTASASASHTSIDLADENEEYNQVQVIEPYLHPPDSPDPILLLNSGKGKAPYLGVDNHDGTRRLFHGPHTAALERKLQHPSSSHIARGEEAEDPIEVEEDSAEEESSTSRRTPSATQIKPGTVSKYVSAIEDQEQKPEIKSNSKARHVDLRNPPHASRKPPSAVKTRMAVRKQQYNPDVASSSTTWNTKSTKSAAQQKNKPQSLKVKLLYFGNEKFEPTDNDPIFLHVNSSIMEIKHGPPKRKSMRTDMVNIEDINSLQLCNTSRQVIYITLNKQLNIGQLNFRRDSKTFTSGHEKAITVEFQAPMASFNGLSDHFTEHGLNKSFIDDNAANALLQRAEMMFENFKSSSGDGQSPYTRRQPSRQSRGDQSSKYFEDSIVCVTDSEDGDSCAGLSTNGVKAKSRSVPIAPDDDDQDLIIQETSRFSRSRSPPVLMPKTRSATRKGKPIAIPTHAPPTPPPLPSPPQRNRESSPLSSLPDSPQPGLEPKLPSGGPDKLVLVYPPTGKGTLNILRSDINRLTPGEYLNDTLIEFGLKRWYNELQERDPDLAEQVHVFNSFLFKKLQDKKPEKGYASVRKWTQRFDLFKKKYIIVPINEHLHWYLAIIYRPDAILEPPPPPEPSRQSVSSRTRSSRAPNTVSDEQDSKPASTNSTDVTEMLMAECSINEIPETPPPAQGSPAQSAPVSDDVMAIDDSSNPVIEISEMHSGNKGHTNDIPKSPPSKKDDANAPGSVHPVDFYGSSSAPSIQEITISKQPRPEPESVDLSLDDCSDDEVEEEKMVLDTPAAVPVSEINKSQTWIFTLDSLNSSHKQAADILKIYLQMEAQDKKGITALGKATSKKIWVPSQNNLWDCGVYLLHFAEVFLKDPEHYCQLMISRSIKKSTSSQELVKEWRAENLDSKRMEIRTFIEDAAKIWAAERERKRLEEPDVAKEESSDDEVIIEQDVVMPEPSPQGVRTRGKRKAQDMEDTPETMDLAMRPRG